MLLTAEVQRVVEALAAVVRVRLPAMETPEQQAQQTLEVAVVATVTILLPRRTRHLGVQVLLFSER